MEELADEIREYIASGRTKNAIEHLLDNKGLFSNHNRSKITILAGQYTNWQDDRNLGLEPSNSHLARINLAILDLLDNNTRKSRSINFWKFATIILSSLIIVLLISTRSVFISLWKSNTSSPISTSSKVIVHEAVPSSKIAFNVDNDLNPVQLVFSYDLFDRLDTFQVENTMVVRDLKRALIRHYNLIDILYRTQGEIEITDSLLFSNHKLIPEIKEESKLINIENSGIKKNDLLTIEFDFWDNTTRGVDDTVKRFSKKITTILAGIFVLLITLTILTYHKYRKNSIPIRKNNQLRMTIKKNIKIL